MNNQISIKFLIPNLLSYSRIPVIIRIEIAISNVWSLLLSKLGGAIGLWIGLSLISMFEVVQLLLECCAFGVHKCRQSKSRDKS
jgi:hypothetical protein